jgi:hypothetical protein
MDIKMKFMKDVVVYVDQDGFPVHGDVVRITVNGQIFQKSFKVYSSKSGIEERERAELFGETLKGIGQDIIIQARYGKSMTVNINGQELKYF